MFLRSQKKYDENLFKLQLLKQTVMRIFRMSDFEELILDSI